MAAVLWTAQRLHTYPDVFRAYVDQQDLHGNTALHKACKHGCDVTSMPAERTLTPCLPAMAGVLTPDTRPPPTDP